jgi:cytochrome c-type biogenesis protein CcmH
MGYNTTYKRTPKKSIAVLGICIALLVVMPLACSTSKTISEIEKEAQAIDKIVVCPVCPASTIDQAQVPISKQIKALIRSKLAKGQTREEILDYLEESYKDSGIEILAVPTKTGFNIIAWIVPIIAFVMGGLVLFLVFKSMRNVAQEEIDSDLNDYLDKVDKELNSEDKNGT